jgi:cardiolipin synthase
MGLAQAITIAVLSIITQVRKRRQPEMGFPRARFPEVEVDGNHLLLYCAGDPLFQDMLDAIELAHTSILLETYIWKGDILGQLFKDRLIKKAEEGVEVYIIIDSFANLVVPPSFKQFPPSLHVFWYGAITRPWHLLDPRRLARDHRKILVVDGEVAFLGGYNIGDLYRRKRRDSHVRVRGPEAARLGQAVINFWNANVSSARQIPWRLRRGVQPRIQYHTNNARGFLFPIRDMYVDAIERAERRVWITTAYFIPDRAMTDALVHAATRGVDVQVLIPWTSNHVAADWLTRGFFKDLLAGKVRFFLYQHAMNHAKTMTVDGTWSTVGTANLDRLSQIGNYEINLEVYDQLFAEQMERLFDIDKSNAIELTARQWEARPWYAKIGEWILAPLRPLF